MQGLNLGWCHFLPVIILGVDADITQRKRNLLQYLGRDFLFLKGNIALVGVAQWIEHRPTNQKATFTKGNVPFLSLLPLNIVLSIYAYGRTERCKGPDP